MRYGNKFMSLYNKKIHHRHLGLTLIEVLIAMAIGLLLLSGAISLFANNKRVFKENNQMGRLQENARFAIELMISDIRRAGFMGCHHDIDQVNNQLSGIGSDSLYAFMIPGATPVSLAVEGLDSGDTSWRPSGNSTDIITIGTAIGERVNNTDAITVRYFSGEHWDVVEDNDGDPADGIDGFMANVTSPLFISTVADHPAAGDVGNNLAQGELLAVTDCGGADIFQLTEACTSLQSPACTSGMPNGRVIGSTAAGVVPGSTSLSRIYAEGSRVRRYHAVRYYIGNGNYGGPSLYRQVARNDNTNSSGLPKTPEIVIEGQELIEGIENMQIMYAVDTNDDGVPDSYSDAASVGGGAQWNNVVAVKIALLLRSIDQEFADDIDTSSYNLLGNNVNPADLRVRRRVFTTTVQLRNRIRNNTI